jgi:dihydroorotate dehydrogenase
MYSWVRPLFFRLSPEQAHRVTLDLIRLAGRLAPVRAVLRAMYAAPAQPVTAFGLTFANPVGLAAGYDKDGLGWRGLATLGFGHIEVGTVTLRPQPGNPRPRIFRLVEDQAVINRMGFPGRGAGFVKRQLPRRGTAGVRLAVNLGKNKATPLDRAAADYLALFDRFAPLADFLVVNVSSPNTPGLRDLQARQELREVLAPLAARRTVAGAPPLLVKLAPDLSDAQLDAALDVILETGMSGVVATNTTIARPPLRSALACETGGLSGAPLRDAATTMIAKIARRTGGRLPIIGVGGIASAADAQAKLDAGACLVQVYTGMIYAGPSLVKQILCGLH